MHEHIRHHEQSSQGSSDRSFGIVFALFFLIVALLPLLHGHSILYWGMVTSAIFGVIAIATPSALKPLNRLWTRFGLLLHGVVSPIALAVLFYGVVTPTGLVMRLIGKDPLRLRLDPSIQSYWIVRASPGPDAESLKNQF